MQLLLRGAAANGMILAMEREKKGRFAALGAAAALVVVGGAKLVDEFARGTRGVTHAPPRGGGAVIGVGDNVGGAVSGRVESQLDQFISTVGDGFTATPEQAREAAVTTACEVLYIAYTKVRLPTEDEWVSIGVDAVAGAALDLPVGSPAWRQLEEVKDEVSAAITDADENVDDSEAESLAQDLACSWA